MAHLDVAVKNKGRGKPATRAARAAGGRSRAGALRAAADAHRKGALDEAEKLYRSVLRAEPRNVDALQLLGVLLHQRGQSDQGLKLLRDALALDPSNGRCHNNIGSLYNAIGEPEKAESHFRQAAEADNPPAEAWLNLGRAQRRRGDLDAALESLAVAEGLHCDGLDLVKLTGGIYMERHQFEEAEVVFRDYLAKHPDDMGIGNNLAYVVQMQGRLDEAEALFRKAMDAAGNAPELGHNMRTLMIAQGREEEARELFRKQLRDNPESWTSELGLALGLALRGLETEALRNMEDILAQFPDTAGVWNDVGKVLMALEKHVKAVKVLTRATEIDPALASASNNLGAAYMHLHQHGAAVPHLKKAVALDPNLVDPYLNLCRALRLVSDHDQANLFAHAALDLKNFQPRYFACLLQAFRGTCDYEGLERLGSPWECAEAIPRNELPAIFLDFLVFSETHDDHRKFFDLVRSWAEFIERDAAHAPLPKRPARAPGGKLRIGWLSSDLRKHSVSRFLTPLMKNYDRDRFEFHCYSLVNAVGDTIQTLIRDNVDSFTFVDTRTPREIAATIQDDGIDILLELNGFTTGSKLETLAYKPAPVQMSWLGYPFTCGLEAIDHILLNPYLDGPGGHPYLVEEPVNMPESWVCFGKFADVPIVSGLPMDHHGAFTFGTLNNIYKYTPSMIALWAEVMKQVPGSRFLIVRPEVDSYVVCKNISAEFARNGIGPERLYFFNNSKQKLSHLAYYNEIDLSLDTFPLTGGTTTCEAVWMGVPVVTLVGELFHQRLSYSVLMQCGLEEFCTYSRDDFVARAVEKANDPDRLRHIRQNLRDVVRASPLCDDERFVYQFQEMLEAVADYHKIR